MKAAPYSLNGKFALVTGSGEAEPIAFLACDAAALVTGTEVYFEGAQSLLQG